MKKKTWLILFLAIIISTMFFYKSNNPHSAMAARIGLSHSLFDPLAGGSPIQHADPTPTPVKFLGMYFNSGFALQPGDKYAFVGQTKTLYVQHVRSIYSIVPLISTFPLSRRTRYTWYTSTDSGGIWSNLDQDTNALSQTFTREGTVYYQVMGEYTHVPLLGVSDLWGQFWTRAWSKVGTVHVLPAPVYATKFHVTTDSVYLMNNIQDSKGKAVADQAVVTGYPTPSNATGVTTWISSNPSLATVDPNAGIVTATTDHNKSGTVTITGTFHNNSTDAPDLTDTIDINVGGGLVDQTVSEGDPATFKLQSDISNNGTRDDNQIQTAEWHKVSPIGKDTIVSAVVSDTYTTPNTTYGDDGSKYYLIVHFQKNAINDPNNNNPNDTAQNFNITTNKANLTVLTKPKITNSIKNNSYSSSKDTDVLLNNVITDDKVTYNIQASNQSNIMGDATLQLLIPKNSLVNDISIDGTELNNTRYTLTPHDDDSQSLAIPVNFDHSRDPQSIQIATTIGDLTTASLQTTPKITYPNGNVSGTGTTLTLNFGTDTLRLMANNFTYGAINSLFGSTLIDRDDANDAFEALKVEDHRRSKTPVQLTLSATPLTDGTRVIPATLRYYFNNGSFKSLGQQEQTIASTTNEQNLDSITWSKKDGVKLFIEKNSAAVGTFRSTLTWSVSDSV